MWFSQRNNKEVLDGRLKREGRGWLNTNRRKYLFCSSASTHFLQAP
jgi:hypothetical protein